MAEAVPRFFNRELSWIEFNGRVLEEARDPAHPPLERLKFLAITGSNLDEFFMVRVGELHRLLRQQRDTEDSSGLTVSEQVVEIGRRVRAQMADQYACLAEIEAVLAEHGVRRLSFDRLDGSQLRHVEQVFAQEILPLLTPLSVSTAVAPPTLPGLTVCLCMRLTESVRSGKRRFVVLPFPRNIGRFVTLEVAKGEAFILLDDVVRGCLPMLFPGERVTECAAFRLARSADLDIREDMAGDLLSRMEDVIERRRESACVRLDIGPGAGPEMRRFLQRIAGVGDELTFDVPGPTGFSSFMTLAVMPGHDRLKAPPLDSQPSPDVPSGAPVFDAIRRHDVLLIHPFDSFEPVVRLLQEAAEDPDVLAIKQILYRTSRNSPVVAALERAAENGKSVTAIVELKARFDEERNIEWARALERAGVQVIYGIRHLKTHAKLLVIVRREAAGIRRYIHFGTGNYNEVTARLYTDVSFMTCNEDLAADAASFFNTITARTQPGRYRKIAAAPLGLRERIMELIETESAFARQGRKAHIMAKMNSLVDVSIIEALYAASAAGVVVELNVRGICCLRPGVPGLSENISVVSIVDRFLEHARIFCFEHGGEPQVWISSGDWMPRNLDRRIELLTPVEDPACRDRLMAALRVWLSDTVKGRRLMPDGRYARPLADVPIRSQEVLYREAVERAAESSLRRREIFEPYRPAGGSS